MEKDIAAHSSILVWKSPWTEETGGLQSMGLRDCATHTKEGRGRWVGSNKLVELKKKIFFYCYFYAQNWFKCSKVSVCVYVKVAQLCLTLCNPMDCSPSGASVLRLPRQEYWGGLPCPPPGGLPNPGIELESLTSVVAGGFFTTVPPREASPYSLPARGKYI